MTEAPVHDPDLSLGTALAVAQTSVLRLVCGLGLANATLLAIVTATSSPTAFGVAATTAWVAAWTASIASAGWLQARLARFPGAVIGLAVAGMAPVAFDGGLHGTLTTQADWLTWVAAVSVGARVTLATAAAMSIAVAGALQLAGPSLHDQLGGADRFQVTLAICTPVVTALVGLAIVGVFRELLASAADTLADISAGAPASTPGLGRLLHRDHPLLLPSPSGPQRTGRAALTRTEAEVVALLRQGRTAQQIALDRGRSLHTIRTQIKHAKRKVGARTLNDLIARTWPTT